MMLTNSENWTAVKVYAMASTNVSPRIEDIEVVSASRMSVSMANGVSYRLQQSENLTSNEWVNHPPTYAGAGVLVDVYAPLGPGESGFYRVTATGMADPGDTIANMASNIIISIDETNETAYHHSTYINEDQDIYRTDCSGFVSYLMGRCSPIHLDFIPREPDYPVPRAFKYYDFFNTVNTSDLGVVSVAWKPITHVQYMKRGDVLVWRNPNWPDGGTDSGHVMIVAEPATNVASNEWHVLVYDSSSTVHFSPDSRVALGTDGVGWGTVKLWVNEENIPVMHQLGASTPANDHPIAIARPQAVW
jgi:hypothetical protein